MDRGSGEWGSVNMARVKYGYEWWDTVEGKVIDVQRIYSLAMLVGDLGSRMEDAGLIGGAERLIWLAMVMGLIFKKSHIKYLYIAITHLLVSMTINWYCSIKTRSLVTLELNSFCLILSYW